MAHRLQAAETWMEKMFKDMPRISAMNPDQCNAVLSRLQTTPAYLTPAHLQKINEVKAELETRLDALQLEGVLARFRQLSMTMRKQFLTMAQQYMRD